MHTCGDILISEILYHYHDMENYIMIVDISIILHITKIEGLKCIGMAIMTLPLLLIALQYNRIGEELEAMN